jgi:Glycosyltransferase family 87
VGKLAQLKAITAKPGFFVFVFGLLYAVLMFQALPRTLRGPMGAADFAHFYEASKALAAGADIYAGDSQHYIYPPLLALLLRPLSLIPLSAAAGMWLVLNGGLLAAAAWLAARAAASRLDCFARDHLIAQAAILGSLLLLIEIHADLHLGQSDGLVLFALVLALNCLDERPITAGLFLGLAGAIKYIALAYIPYLVLRRRWRAAASSAAGWIGWMLLPSIFIGWTRNLNYIARAVAGLFAMSDPNVGSARPGASPALGTLAGISGVVWERSVSLTSAVMRHLGKHPGEIWAIAALLGLAVICLAFAWLLVRKSGFTLWTGRGLPADAQVASNRALVLGEWSAVLTATLLFSPQLTERHFVLLLPVTVLASFLFLTARRFVDRFVLGAGTVLLLAGLYLPPGGIVRWEAALAWWRDIGGLSWCALLFFFSVFAILLRLLADDRRRSSEVFGLPRPVHTPGSKVIKTLP